MHAAHQVQIAVASSGAVATALQLLLVVGLSLLGAVMLARRGETTRGQDDAPDSVSRALGRLGLLPPEMRQLRREMRGDLRRIRQDVSYSRHERRQHEYACQSRVLAGLLGGELHRVERNEVCIQGVVLHIRRSRRGRSVLADQVTKGEALRLDHIHMRGGRLHLEFRDRHMRRFPLDFMLQRIEVRL